MNVYPRSKAVFRNFGPGGGYWALSCGFLDKTGHSYDVANETYDRVAMVYLLNGGGRYWDSLCGWKALEAGSLFFRLPDRQHTTVVEPESGWHEVFVAVRAQWLELLQEAEVLTPKGTAVLGPWVMPELPARVLKLMSKLEKAGSVSELSKVEFAMADMMRAAGMGELTGGGDSGGVVSPEERARRRIEAELESARKVEDLLAGLGMSYARLRALFVRAYGVSPGEYRIRARIDRACALLKTTKMPLADVAARLGYADAFAFSRQFKNRMGISPGAFRRGA